jgi:aminopeptidase N
MTPLDWVPTDEGLVVHLPRPYSTGESLTLRLRYHASPRVGLRFVHQADGPVMVYTHGEPAENQNWFPGWDEPDDRATAELVVVVPKGQDVVANGALVETVPVTAIAPGSSGDDLTVFHYYEATPHPMYLDAFVAGALTRIETKAGAVSLLAAAPVSVPKPALSATFGDVPDMLAFFGDYLHVPYPYASYSETLVPRFVSSGMENIDATTLTVRTLADASVGVAADPDPLLAHELFHQWFGDDVTCESWADLWLNEGAATFGQLLYAEHHNGADEYALERQANLDRVVDEMKNRYSRPIVDRDYDQADSLFDSTTYSKGALVLHMLRVLLGDATLRNGLSAYLHDHAPGNASTADLERALETSAGGASLAWFFDQWIYRAGIPTVESDWKWDAAKHQVTLHVTTTTADAPADSIADSPAEAPYRLPTSVALYFDHGDPRVEPVLVDAADRSFVLDVPKDRGPPRAVVLDPEHDLVAIEARLGPATDDDSAAPTSAPTTPEGDPNEAGFLLTHSTSAATRLDYARALAGEPAGQAVPILADCLTHDAFYGVRAACASSLGSLTGAASLAALRQAVHDTDPRVVIAVAKALGSFPEDVEPSAAATLTALLQSHVNPLVRAAAAEALGHTHASGAWDTLTQTLASPDATWNDVVRAGAARGLGALGDARAIPLLVDLGRSDPTVDERTAEAAILSAGSLLALERPGPSVRDTEQRLALQLQSAADTNLRQAAARALAAVGDPDALALLTSALPGQASHKVSVTIQLAVQTLKGANQALDSGAPTDVLPDLAAAQAQADQLAARVDALTGPDADSPPGGPGD